MSYEMMPQSGYGAYELMPQSGYGQFGLGDDSSDCPKGTESWCYNPLVMYMRDNYPGVLQSSNVTNIRDTFKKALLASGRIPTSNVLLLKTPTQAVVDAIASYHRIGPVASQLPFSVLWTDSVVANFAAVVASKTPATSKTVASSMVIPESIMRIQVPAPTKATTSKVLSAPFPATANAPSTGPAMELPAEAKKIPWLLIGAGVLVVGGAVLLLRK